MRLIASATAALAAVAIAAPAASADHYETTIDRVRDAVTMEQPAVPYHPCLFDVTVPNCVNWALDTGLETVQELRRVYNEEIQPAIDPQYCKVHYILDGTPCPDRTPTL